MTNILLVGAGGMIGAITRYSLSLYFVQYLSYPTALINLVGSLLMGVILGMGQMRLGESWSLFIATGLLGGFTTYSAFAGETLTLLKEGFYFSALGYTSLTLFGGLVMVALGFYLGKIF